MTHCARTGHGCTPRQGQHTPPCACTTTCPTHDDHCTGCTPRATTHGLLCDGCSRRLRGALGAEQGLGEWGREIHGLPWVFDALTQARPSLRSQPKPGRGGPLVRDPEAERAITVLMVRTQIWQLLLDWTETLLTRPGLSGPNLAADQRTQVIRCATWLLAHIDILETHEAITDCWDEMCGEGNVMWKAHALIPWRPVKPTLREGIPCMCGAWSHIYDYGDQLMCSVCLASYTREEYDTMTKLATHFYAKPPR